MPREEHLIRQVEYKKALEKYGYVHLEHSLEVEGKYIRADIYAEIEGKKYIIEIGDIDDEDKGIILGLYAKLHPEMVFIHEHYGENKLEGILQTIRQYFNSSEYIENQLKKEEDARKREEARENQKNERSERDAELRVELEKRQKEEENQKNEIQKQELELAKKSVFCTDNSIDTPEKLQLWANQSYLRKLEIDLKRSLRNPLKLHPEDRYWTKK